MRAEGTEAQEADEARGHVERQLNWRTEVQKKTSTGRKRRAGGRSDTPWREGVRNERLKRSRGEDWTRGKEEEQDDDKEDDEEYHLHSASSWRFYTKNHRSPLCNIIRDEDGEKKRRKKKKTKNEENSIAASPWSSSSRSTKTK